MKTDEDRNKWLLYWHPVYREYQELVLHGRACNFAGLDPGLIQIILLLRKKRIND